MDANFRFRILSKIGTYSAKKNEKKISDLFYLAMSVWKILKSMTQKIIYSFDNGRFKTN
jgi:hypothetical protein